MKLTLRLQEAPKSVDMFLKLIKGELLAQCIDEDEAFDEDAFGVSDRDKQTKKQIYKQCKAREDVPLSYEYSIASRVVKDQRIDLGRYTSAHFLVAPCVRCSRSYGHGTMATVIKDQRIEMSSECARALLQSLSEILSPFEISNYGENFTFFFALYSNGMYKLDIPALRNEDASVIH